MDGVIDHRGLVNWEKVQELLAEAVFNGYVRGVQDYKNEDISLDNICEEVEDFNKELKEHYYE